MKDLDVFIVSDSSGETALTIAQTAMAQFPGVHPVYQRFPFIQTESILHSILNLAQKKQAIIFHTLVTKKLSNIVDAFADANDIDHFDCIQPALNAVARRTEEEPMEVPSLNHNLTETYFDRIAAMEFAVTYDDGKDPAGLAKADIVLLGVSRTSKTPLSLFLANRGLKVANLPLAPKTQLPDELWEVDSSKIIGLTNDPGTLRKIRQERMISYGLPAESAYSDTEEIKQELDYALKLYKKLNCLIINVANKSIEETASLIMESLNIDNQDFT